MPDERWVTWRAPHGRLLLVSSEGRFADHRGFVTPTIHPKGYAVVSTSRGVKIRVAYWAHRAVWEAFFGPIPHGWDIHHLNGNRTDNCIANMCVLEHGEHCSWTLVPGCGVRICARDEGGRLVAKSVS